jgi:hypothetical protein
VENMLQGKASQLVLPEFGKFTIADWATILGCSDKTVRNNVKKYSIRTIKCGGTVVIMAEWWWEALLLAGGGDDNEEETGD